MIINKPAQVEIHLARLPIREIRKRAGLPSAPNAASESIEPLLEEIIKNASNIIESKGSYAVLKISDNDQRIVRFSDLDFVIDSLQIAKLFSDSDRAVLFMTTIGPRVDEWIKSYQEAGKVTEAFLLDAAGSEIADAVAEKLHRRIIPGLMENDTRVTPRFSPGYGDWLLTAQSQINAICQGEKIGITLNKSCLMHPRKSVSAIFGIRRG